MTHEAITKRKIIKSKEPVSKLETYLKKMRRYADTAPSLDEITKIVEEVRTERYAKK